MSQVAWLPVSSSGGLAQYGLNQDLKSAALAYWKMEEAANSSRLDSAGSSHTLLSSGSTPQVTGKVISPNDLFAAQVKLSNELSVSTTDFRITDGLTTAFWVQTTNDGIKVFGKFYDGGGNDWDLTSAFGAIQFQVTDSVVASSSAVTSTVPADSAWHFIVAWYDPADLKAHIDLDGGAEATSGAVLATGPRILGTDFALGVQRVDYITFDRLVIFRGVLTSSQRLRLWNSGAGLALW